MHTVPLGFVFFPRIRHRLQLHGFDTTLGILYSFLHPLRFQDSPQNILPIDIGQRTRHIQVRKAELSGNL